LNSVLAIHDRQLAEHSGQRGIRDMNGLQSALARPQNLLAYETPPPSLFRLAAAYAFGICRNHPFADGNKRTAAVVCLTFLGKNGINTAADEEELADMFERLAAGRLTESRLTRWLEKIAVSIKKSPRRAG
jgi:death-on-curing protein